MSSPRPVNYRLAAVKLDSFSKKILLGVGSVAILVLSEAAYAHLRVGSGLDVSGEYLRVHIGNNIWGYAVAMIVFLFVGGIGIWGIRAASKWRIRPRQKWQKVLYIRRLVPTLVVVSLQILRVILIALAIAAALFNLIFVLVFEFSPVYEDLHLTDSATLLDMRLSLFPKAVDRHQINVNNIKWLEYASSGDGIAMVGVDGSRLLIFEDFTIEQEVAETIAQKLEKPLEHVEQIE